MTQELRKRGGGVGLAAKNRKKSRRQIIPQNCFGSAAVACLVLGCAWTVYTNVFGASVYPAISSAAFDTPVARQPASAAVRSKPPAFNEVFAALPEAAPAIPRPESVPSSIMFNERFAASAPQSEPSRVVDAADAPTPKEAPKLAEAPKSKEAAPVQVALNVPARPAETKFVEAKPADGKSADTKNTKSTGSSVRDMAQRAKAAVMSIASHDKQSIVEKLWGKQPSHGSLLSYASADVSATGSLPGELGQKQNPLLGGSPPYDRQTAVYDIAARTVYLPDGTRLEAHSGLGSKMDDVRYAHVRMHGVTPPHIYELKPREALFHGVPALRLTPIGGDDAIFGRTGLLAHTYMLGPNGDSNGCVSFKDYYAFLNAYKTQGIRRLAVLAKVQ